MRPSSIFGVCVAGLAIVVGVVVVRVPMGRAMPAAPATSGATATPTTPTTPALTATQLRELDIAFWARRAASDTLGAEDRVHLAALLLGRARETGDYGDYLRADTVARAALRIRPTNNAKGQVLLASALMAQHRFDDAYQLAVQIDTMNPGVPNYAALRGEVALETGRYDEARRLFDAARGGSEEGSVAARMARFEEIEGRTASARWLIARAVKGAESNANLPAEQVAWYRLRLGDFDLRHGRLAAADSMLRAGLASAPNDYRLLGTMARLEWMRGRWQASADFGERAVANVLDPATLAVLSDDYRALGDTARAEQFAAAMRASVMSQTGPLHRAWSLFLLDHGRDRAGVLARAREELHSRRDIYGYDVLAWALHASGRDAEAWTAAQRALAEGTEDATLHYHAGVIADALGRRDDARMHLARALAVNASFHPVQAVDAKARLAKLETAR